MPIRLKSKGDHMSTRQWLKKMKELDRSSSFSICGLHGVQELAEATPIRTGLTAASWRYEINDTSTGKTIDFINDNRNGNFNVAIGLQYGHGTGTGGYVPAIDYVNPAIEPVFKELADNVWKEIVG